MRLDPRCDTRIDQADGRGMRTAALPVRARSLSDPPGVLISEARQAYPKVPLLAVAGIDARNRLIDALCEADVNHVMPKRGALTLPRGGMPVLGSLEGPDELDLQVLSLLIAGASDARVARQLDVGLRTVQRRVRSLMDATAATTRIQLGWAAYERGWLRRP